MTPDSTFNAWASTGLVWLPEHGMAHYPVDDEDHPYDAAYLSKYAGYAETAQGRAITQARVDLVDRYLPRHARVLDFGIGAGAFIEARNAGITPPTTFGYDINPAGIQWLNDRGLFAQCDERGWHAITFFDVLEHLKSPSRAVRWAAGYVFACLPIFEDDGHLRRSHHFRRDEHRWYWTADGLRAWMRCQGFECVEFARPECNLGRTDIGTFVFRRGAMT